MTNDSFFALMCLSMFALLYGSILAFSGYRFFMFLLPIWGFFFGFAFGAHTVQAIFGSSFLSEVTSWVVGFFIALTFAVLSYLFYVFAVAMISGSFGYAIGAGIMLAILPNFGILAWIVGIVVGVAFAIAVLALNIQKLVIIVGTFLFMVGGLPPAELVENPVRAALRGSPLWMIIFIIVAGLGIFGQMASTRRWEIESYNRWEELTVASGT